MDRTMGGTRGGVGTRGQGAPVKAWRQKGCHREQVPRWAPGCTGQAPEGLQGAAAPWCKALF